MTVRPVFEPAFRSLAMEHLGSWDYLDVVLVKLPPGAPTDPGRWAREIFSSGAPPIASALMKLRQVAVRVIGVARSSPQDFQVRAVVGDEALLAVQERHLDFTGGVGVDPEAGVVRVVTAVRLKGWRGHLYFAPVRLLHRPVTSAMMRRAARRLTPSGVAAHIDVDQLPAAGPSSSR